MTEGTQTAPQNSPEKGDFTASKFGGLSRGVVGSAVVLIFALLGLLGFQISPEDTDLARGQAEQIIMAVAALVALWGRIKARKRVHFLKPPPERII